MTDSPIRRTGSSEIASVLRSEISDNTWNEFDRLPPERELAARFGVSRGTVRDALAKLSKENLVEIRRSSGSFVTPCKRAEFTDLPFESIRPLELIDARFALEPHICRLAVLNARRADFEDLEVLLESMEAEVNDWISFSDLDAEFHARLVETTGNQLLLWMARQIDRVRIQDEWMRMRRLTLEPPIIVQYNSQHRRIVDAIRKRDPELAANIMKEHLETARLSLTRAAAT
ncbi:MAG: FadR/GntR family transcriptional regulator [Albidovulum sp.]|nr:FadR/GntR family transcriptional regulator [Albidovulum sp.]